MKTNTTTYNRIKKPTKFFVLSKPILDLPFIERGIMIEILSNADTFVIDKEVIRKRTGLGRDFFNKHWTNLKELGHIETKRIRREVIYTINESTTTESSTTKSTTTESSSTRIRSTITNTKAPIKKTTNERSKRTEAHTLDNFLNN